MLQETPGRRARTVAAPARGTARNNPQGSAPVTGVGRDQIPVLGVGGTRFHPGARAELPRQRCQPRTRRPGPGRDGRGRGGAVTGSPLTGSRPLRRRSPCSREWLGSSSDSPADSAAIYTSRESQSQGHPSPQTTAGLIVSIPGPWGGWGAVLGLRPHHGAKPPQGSASVPESWNKDCFRRLSRAHRGQVVELS